MKRRRQPPRRAQTAGDGRLRAGAELTVRVERILPGGVGLAHAEGVTLFVSLAAPGDLARVRVESVRGRALFASLEEVLEPSPARSEPPCPYFGRCGGCDFQQLTYRAQLAAKAEIIRDCLRRVAHTEPPSEFEAVAGDEGVALEPSVEPGDEREQVRHIGGETYRFDAGCFFQINHALL